MPTYRQDRPVFQYLYERPSPDAFGVGQCLIAGVEYTSDGVTWRSGNPTSIEKTWSFKGVALTEFTSGVSSLSGSSLGSGVSLATSKDFGGKGVTLTGTGARVASNLEFYCTPFLLEATTVINVLAYATNPGALAGGTIVFCSTQAVGFGSYFFADGAEAPRNSSCPLGGGLYVQQVTGTELEAGTTGASPPVLGTTMVDYIRLRTYVQQGTSVTILGVYVDTATKPMVHIGFDDGYTSQYTKAFAYMSRFGLKGTIAVNSAKIGLAGRLTLDQMHEMYDAGWDFVSHTANHMFARSGYGVAAGSSSNYDHICASQSVTAGNNFVINGSIGLAPFPEPLEIAIVSAGNDDGKRFIVYGVDEYGVTTTDMFSGGNGSTVYSYGSSKRWTQITRIQCLDSTASTIKVGVLNSYSAMYADMLECKNWLLDNGFTRGSEIYVAPGGDMTRTVKKVLDDLGYKAARLVTPNLDYPNLAPHPFGIPSLFSGIANGGSATVIAAKDNAKARCGSVGLYLHQIVENSVSSPSSIEARNADFRLVIDNFAADVKAGNLSCPTLSEYCSYAGYC